jgi:hypothetical protein
MGRHVDDRVEQFSVEADPRTARLAEALAALSANRKGLVEAELLELFARVLGVADRLLTWDIVRAWIEAGYLDLLSRRAWRGRVYFARRPRLVIARPERHPVVVLHGLAPYRLRQRAHDVLSGLGASQILTHSVSTFVGAPPAWVVEDVEMAAAAADELSLDRPQFVRSPAALMSPLPVSPEAGENGFPGYAKRGSWDWGAGGFRPSLPRDATTSVVVDWLTRPDRPDMFVVRREDGCWSTHLRNWALLVGYRWANKPGFETIGQSGLLKVELFGPYIPLPVARAIALRSGVTSGPADRTGLDRRYVYWCGTATDRRWVIQQLQEPDGKESAVHLQWLIGALAHGSSAPDSMPIPIDLVRRLRRLDFPGKPTFTPGRMVSRRLVPHIRRALKHAGV